MMNILSEIIKHMPLKDVIQIVPSMLYEPIEQLSDYTEQDYTEVETKKLKKIISVCQKGIEAFEIAASYCNDLLENNVKDPDQLNKLKNWSVGNPTKYRD